MLTLQCNRIAHGHIGGERNGIDHNTELVSLDARHFFGLLIGS